MAAKEKPKTTKLLDQYYATLAAFGKQYVLHEGATRIAFQNLLTDAARPHHWTLIGELTENRGGKQIRPDGTLKDIFLQVRGYWEAKDTKDDLTTEISKKTKAGYPLTNIIFEDTREAVLIQNKTEVMRIQLSDREALARLLETFFDHIEPEIENFEKAVTEFKERVPALAKGLKELLAYAHRGNGKTGDSRIVPNVKFNAAFATFMDICRSALNPTITEAAVDDMLVQHLLTERLIRTVFDNPEFTRRNVIAVEIEKVVDALTSKAFNRDVFLRSLDRFYLAIENSARTMPEWSDKQGFLNTVYERFFQGYSVKLADTMGIVYTPQPIVDFMCASVVEVLEKEFGRSLGDPGVNILDPCTGTGNFIVNLLRRVPKKDLSRVYKEQLFANEIMLLPYYIAALNIEHAYYEQTGEYEPFEGLCFVDTLDLAESHQTEMSFMTAKNTERVARQKRTPITVVIGNPPYNAHQLNENDNNKNRSYGVIDARIRETYAADSRATLKAALGDAYVKFFRFASDRLGDREGIVCFVTNNSFTEQNAFDGMRRHLGKDFTSICHLDLHGNVRHNPQHSGTVYNVFGIQVGVGITIAVRRAKVKNHEVLYAEVDEGLRRENKLRSVAVLGSCSNVNWRVIKPDASHNWLAAGDIKAFSKGIELVSKSPTSQSETSIFITVGPGVNSSRDDVVYDFNSSSLKKRVEQFCSDYSGEVDRYKRSGRGKLIDDFIDYSRVKWSSTLKIHLKRGTYATFDTGKIKYATYRPFTSRFLYHDEILNDRPGLFLKVFPPHLPDANQVIALTNPGSEKPFLTLMGGHVIDYHIVGAGAGAMCFPFYIYDQDGTNRRENITDWSLDQFRTQYKDKMITKWNIFHYVYGLLHHPGYRTKFADNLKRELPRIPFAPDFRAFAAAGAALAKLHLEYESLEPWPLKWIETPGVPLSYRVEKMKLSKDKATLTVNKSLMLADIPAEVSRYRLGNRSALDWVVDQYQVSTDKRSGIVSDPNRDDDEQYIVRLVGQVVRVSMETVAIVENLPADFAALDKRPTL